MTQYEKTWPWLRYLLAPEKLEHILANVFAELQFKNLRVAETEKYAHVTYFFNGGVEKPFPGEERILVPSPKVPTYDLKPEMSAAGIADTVVHAIEKGEFDAIIMNFANADMVGHSGNLEATIKAVETVDACLGQIFQALRPRGGAWIITADHGNAETMIDPVTGGPHTYHTTNPVPFILLTDDGQTQLNPGGSLRDIAPTMLGVLGVAEPSEMTGRDLRVLDKIIRKLQFRWGKYTGKKWKKNRNNPKAAISEPKSWDIARPMNALWLALLFAATWLSGRFAPL